MKFKDWWAEWCISMAVFPLVFSLTRWNWRDLYRYFILLRLCSGYHCCFSQTRPYLWYTCGVRSVLAVCQTGSLFCILLWLQQDIEANHSKVTTCCLALPGSKSLTIMLSASKQLALRIPNNCHCILDLTASRFFSFCLPFVCLVIFIYIFSKRFFFIFVFNV